MDSPQTAQAGPDASQKHAIPSIGLPKGGGAIRGIGEKFAANPVTGTGSMSVPIATSPGRSGFGPQLALRYDSGAGNGPFGFGWTLDLPQISRKTDKGLPRYRDADESDVFVLSGVEDLVPMLAEQATGWVPEALPDRSIDAQTYSIRRYRPRIEGVFARIERWTRHGDGDVHWRSYSADNVLTLYGWDGNSRIADPMDPLRVFTWLISETRDDKGNAVLYEYKAEDGTGVDTTRPHERNRGERDDPRREVNRYPKRILYGNRETLLDAGGRRPPLLSSAQRQAVQWMFEVVFDYGEHAADAPQADDGGPWRFRRDPFSSYRAGFEVRTTRLCSRVLMFHHFAEAPDVGAGCLVRSTDFDYSRDPAPDGVVSPAYSFLLSVAQSGYKRANGGYRKRQLPPVEYEYTQAVVQDTVHDVDTASLENLPAGVDGAAYQWTDLHGEGIPGIFTEQAGAWFYTRNVSPISTRAVEFAPTECVAAKPKLTTRRGQPQFVDLSGDGQVDLVELDGPMPGLYEHDEGEGWRRFRPFLARLGPAARDRNIRFIDLDGDGRADVLVTEDDAFVWYASLANEGFGVAQRVTQALDDEKGPRLVFDDGSESIYLADLDGDGLTDLVRIRNGDICYWPNLGFGRFGDKVTMDAAPRLDHPDQFDQRRVRLADIDGTGTTDLIYLHRDGVRLYFNHSGNSWGEARILNAFPRVDDLVAIAPADLFGNGTACLVWSSPLPGDTRRPMRYVDLMGGQKPHLLVRSVNNLGAETRVSYVTSTRFYLADKAAGKPWITKLPFPVHCVEKVTVTDKWRQTRFSTSYAYHHGYFDGVEREFRGFGRVEQLDVESYGQFAQGNSAGPYITSDKTLYQPPVKTVTWYHTGAPMDRAGILSQFAHEYFPKGLRDLSPDVANMLEGLQENGLPEPDLHAQALDADEWREALRACKGIMLRQETYELDVDALERGEHRPVKLFSTAYRNCHIRRPQPRASNRHAVFLVAESEAITYHYELDLRAGALRPDPRIVHSLNLRFDEYANVLQSLVAVYPRSGQFDSPLSPDALALIRDVQGESHLVYTERRYTGDVADADNLRLRVPCEVLNYELTGFGGARYFALDALRRFRFSEVHQSEGEPVRDIAYHRSADAAIPRKRLIEHTRTLFMDDSAASLAAPLPLGELGRLGLPYETYGLALTDDLLAAVFEDKLAPDVTEALKDPRIGGYLSGAALASRFPGGEAGEYWIRSGIAGYASDAAQHFFLPRQYNDAFGSVTMLTYDPLGLFVVATTDPLGNTSRVERFDFRVLAPAEMRDINSNLSEVAFDVLGLPAAMAVKGKGDEGDTLTALDDALVNPEASVLATFFDQADLDEARARTWLAGASARHVYYFGEVADADGAIIWAVHPPCACDIVRETHVSELAAGAQSRLETAFVYSDGGGNVLVTKAQAEPESPGQVLRWVASGKTVLNNKGKPVKQYEPYFSSSGHRFEEPVEAGVTTIVYYDAAGRAIRTEMPDGTLSRIEFSPWFARSFDPNDTVRECKWYTDRNPHDPGLPLPRDLTGHLLVSEEQRAAWLAARHADTPRLAVYDSLGREVVSIAHNRIRDAAGAHTFGGERWRDEYQLTFTKLDAEGKPLWIRDARGNRVMQYIMPPAPANQQDDPASNFAPCYDISGNLLFQQSMEAGGHWMLNNAAGRPIFAWDSRGHIFHSEYDVLRRPSATFVTGTDPLDMNRRIQVEKIVYGDTPENGLTDAQRIALNLRGKTYQHYDGAGVGTSMSRNPATGVDEAFDFKGNLLRSVRRLVQDYKTPPDWLQNPALESEGFSAATRYDALNRPIQFLAPYGNGPGGRINVIRPGYNEAGMLERVDVWLGQADEPAAPLGMGTATHHVVVGIDYDAKGQRTGIRYGNGVATMYEHDPLTFRLARLLTDRGSGFVADWPQPPDPPRGGIQNLNYFYDAVGNVTRIRDDAQQTAFFSGQRVEPSADYEYDAIYRLISATGREHIGQHAAPQVNEDDSPRMNHPLPTDAAALRNYTETYDYDAVGNILTMIHEAGASGSWTRRYDYEANSNRLKASSLPGDAAGVFSAAYEYDVHGNMMRMPHLPRMRWDHRDQLLASARQVVNAGSPETTWYVYDAGGRRVRKVTERAAAEGGTPKRMNERVYLGGVEIYREYGSDGATVTLERETMHVMDDARRVAMVETKTLDANSPVGVHVPLIRYQFGNHLGSAALELDDAARIISYEEYYPYGSTSYQAGRSVAETSLKRYRYTGEERDEETGLAYHAARYYAPWLGRWTGADPSGLGGGINLYGYAFGNPAKYSDKSGAEPDLDTFDEYVPGLLSDYPRLGQVWDEAAGVVLENRFGKGSLAANKKAFEAALDKLPEGAKRTEFARELFNSTRSGFYRRVGKLYEQGIKVLGGVDVPKDIIDKMIAGGTRPAPGVQLDHAIHELAEAPHKALDAGNIGPRKGHAGVPGGSHYKATEGRKGRKLLGKAAVALLLLDASVAAAKTARHLLNGEFRAAGKEVVSFAYDQTVGTAVEAAGMVKDVAEFISDPLAGIRETIDEMKKMQAQQDAMIASIFGRNEPKTPASPPPPPAPAPRPAPKKPDRGNAAMGLMLLAYAIALAGSEAANAPPSVETSTTEGPSSTTGGSGSPTIYRHPLCHLYTPTGIPFNVPGPCF